MFKKIMDKLNISWYELAQGFLLIIIIILFFVATMAKEKPSNDNNEINTYLNLSTYQDNDIVNLARPDLTGKEYLGNGVYEVYNNNNVVVKYNIYYGTFHVNGSPSMVVGIDLYINPDLINTTVSIKNLTGRDNVPFYVTWKNTVDFSGNLNNNEVKTANRENDNIRFQLVLLSTLTYDNVIYKIQLEEGDTATPYQTPLGPIKQHEGFIYNNAYNEGYDTGYIDGVGSVVKDFVEGNEWNFLQYEQSYATNVNVNMASNYLTTYIDIPINAPKEAGFNYLQMNLSFLKNLRLINEPIQEGAIQVGTHFSLRNENNQELTKVWNVLDNDYQILFDLPNVYKIRLNIVYSVENPNMNELQRMQQQSIISSLINELTNEGKYFTFYIKEGIVFDTDVLGHFIDYQKNIIHLDYVTELVQEYERGLNKGLNDGYNNGYNDGIKINPNNNFGAMIASVLVGVGSILSIQLLPNISIGAIIAVPIVFGVIAFVLGRKKE